MHALLFLGGRVGFMWFVLWSFCFGLLWVCCCLILSLWISLFRHPAKYRIFIVALEVNEPMPTGKKKNKNPLISVCFKIV